MAKTATMTAPATMHPRVPYYADELARNVSAWYADEIDRATFDARAVDIWKCIAADGLADAVLDIIRPRLGRC